MLPTNTREAEAVCPIPQRISEATNKRSPGSYQTTKEVSGEYGEQHHF